MDLFTLLKRELVKEGIPLLEQHGELVENTLRKKTPYGGRLPERNEWLNKERREKMSLRPEVFYYVG